MSPEPEDSEEEEGGDGGDGTPGPGSASDNEVAPIPEPPATNAVDKIKLTVRGEEGNLRLQAKLTTTAGSICRHYCNKYHITGPRAESMRLYFDGESFEPDTEIGDMDLEAGDLVDVS